MADLPIRVTDADLAPPRSPEIVALGSDAPTLSELFQFMRDAELRWETIRFRYLERTFGAAGERREVVEVWIRHPGRAKVITRREGAGISRDFHVWVSDGENATTYDARTNVRTVRPIPGAVLGATDPDLPGFARVYVPRTRLPLGSMADAFVHPHGLARNVMVTGEVSLLGTKRVANGREAFIVRVDRPRRSHVLTDRPDHRIELAVDRSIGMILRFVEGIGDRVTRDAEVTDIALDEPIPDETFALHVSSDVRLLY